MVKQVTLLIIALLCSALAAIQMTPSLPADRWVTMDARGQYISICQSADDENTARMFGRLGGKEGVHPLEGAWGGSSATKDYPSSRIWGESWEFRADGTFAHKVFEKNVVSWDVSNPQYSTTNELKHGQWKVRGNTIELYFEDS